MIILILSIFINLPLFLYTNIRIYCTNNGTIKYYDFELSFILNTRFFSRLFYPTMAALSWHQRHINLGYEFVLDTTDKILTQIRDLIDIDEPRINQDLLIANISEKIFFDYRSIKRNIDETYEQGINEVFNQYKYIISSRVANGDIPDQCVKEIICAIEQFKTRLLARAGKMMKGNMIDEIFKLTQNHLKEKGYDSKKLDLIKDEFKQLMNNLSENNEFNVQTIVDKTRSSTLPIMQSHMEKLKANQEVQSYQTGQQEQGDSMKSESNITPKIHSSYQRTKKSNSDYDTTSSITKHIPNDFNEKDQQKKEHKQKPHHSRKNNDYDSQQISNTIIPFTNCADYDPYRNYEQYKAKRLHNNKQKNVY
ncbi:unnamed protein product [Rotaria sp. Silwood1]|nr:unnamed protein product [Rotaria sp. Silwood1]CAF1346731.1 unnamed protein product [Rotaria sp. Silwood1]